MGTLKNRRLRTAILNLFILVIVGLRVSCISDSNMLDKDKGKADPVWLDLYDWYEVTDPQLDPLFDHRPPSVSCGAPGWYLEQETIEVDTEYCNYLSLEYRIGTPVPASSRLKGAVWHFDLVAIEPSFAHVAILIDHRIVWERDEPIPSGAGIYNLDIELNAGLDAGTPIQFHLHNHGENVWNLSALRFEPPLLLP